jgi:hypothetical protein
LFTSFVSLLMSAMSYWDANDDICEPLDVDDAFFWDDSEEDTSEENSDSPGPFGLAGRRAFDASLRPPACLGAGSVLAEFTKISGGRPPRNALIALRNYFPCTGEVTRDQKRRHVDMAQAFEDQAPSILAAMQVPSVAQEVASILAFTAKRQCHRDRALENAVQYLGLCSFK